MTWNLQNPVKGTCQILERYSAPLSPFEIVLLSCASKEQYKISKISVVGLLASMSTGELFATLCFFFLGGTFYIKNQSMRDIWTAVDRAIERYQHRHQTALKSVDPSAGSYNIDNK